MEKLIIKIAEAVVELLRNAEYPDTAKALEKTLREFQTTESTTTETIKELINDPRLAEVSSLDLGYVIGEFGPALEATAGFFPGHLSVQHTGGGVYVMYYAWDESGRLVGITPSEDTEGTWLVVGYLAYNDEGHFVTENVPTAELTTAIKATATKVREIAEGLVERYEIPGKFIVNFDARHDASTFTWVPAAGSAGYFGPHAIDAETGMALPKSKEQVFWQKVGGLLDQGYPDDQFVATWEG